LTLIGFVLVAFTVLVTTGYGKMQQRADSDQRELVSKTRGAKFEVPSPTGSGIIAGKLYKRSKDPHSSPTYNIHLIRQDGSDAGWKLDDVVYVAWSADGTKLAIEDESHQIYVASLYGDPVLVGKGYTTPALSPSGNLLAAQKLGEGEHILHQVESSPGIAIKDLASGEEYIVASNDVYAPFFIGENRIGFGSGGKDHIATLYARDLQTEEVAKLTNITNDPAKLDPFPIAPPVYDMATNTLRFTAEDNGAKAVFELSLYSKVLFHRTDLEPELYQGFVTAEIESDAEPQIDTAIPQQVLLFSTNAVAAKTLFRLPMDAYGGIYGYYDHSGKDWGCGTRTYSGHRGTDFKLPTGTTVRAAAAGGLYYRYDNCPNEGSWTSTCGGSYGNHVRIEHSDKRVTIYAHMKKGTPSWPSSVLCGAYVGQSGSSGKSTNPHLHFEVWQTRSSGSRLDPYLGSCNSIGTSDWTGQGQYPSGAVITTCAR
jgi:murein DD-endopeptidase MepM/ murein hydrolase activator NlpD